MDAIQLGPLVLPLARLYALGGLLVLVLTTAGLSRWAAPGLDGWAGRAILAGVIAGRAAYVAAHASAFAAEPWSVLMIWQGGFDPWWGAGVAGLYGLWHYRGRIRLQLLAQLPLAAGIGAWLALTGIHQWAAQEPPKLPDLALPALAGPERSLGEWRGEPLVVNLWASWCPPCRREMPRLAEAARSGEAAFVFVNEGEGPAAVKGYLAAHPFELPVVLLDRERRIPSRFGVRGLPTTLFFDAEGRLVASHMGELSRAALQDYLQRIGGG